MPSEIEFEPIAVQVEWENGERRSAPVGEWPQRTMIATELLHEGSAITRDGDNIVVSLTTECARYHIDCEDEAMARLECTLVAVSAPPATGADREEASDGPRN